jgi:23S rRNA pseudoU1915 N3-methylase RlmH
MKKTYTMRLVRSRQKAKADAEEKKQIKTAQVADLMDQSSRLRSVAFALGGPYGMRMPDWAREVIARNDARIRELLA